MAPHRGAVLCLWVVCVLLVICTASEHQLPAVHLSDVLSDALAVLPTQTLADLDDRYGPLVDNSLSTSERSSLLEVDRSTLTARVSTTSRSPFEAKEAAELSQLASLSALPHKTKEVYDRIAAAKAELSRIEKAYMAAREAETAAGQRKVIQDDIQAKQNRLASLLRTAAVVADDSVARATEYVLYQQSAALFAGHAFKSFQSQTQVAGWELKAWVDKVRSAASRYKKATKDLLNSARDDANRERLSVKELHRVAGAAQRLNTHLAASLAELVPEAIDNSASATDDGVSTDFEIVETYDEETKRLRAEMTALKTVLAKNRAKIRAESRAFGSLDGVTGAVEGEGAMAASLVDSAFRAATNGQVNTLVKSVREMLASRALSALKGSDKVHVDGLTAWGSSPEELQLLISKLQAHGARLKAARKVLEAELARRADRHGRGGTFGARSMSSGGRGGKGTGSVASGANGNLPEVGGCEYCMEERELARLLDAVRRLRGELKDCRDDPGSFQPDCEDALKFQITRLSEEVAKRRAVLAGEEIHLKRASEELKDNLQRCEAAGSSSSSATGTGSGSGSGSAKTDDGCTVSETREMASQMRRINLELKNRVQAEWEGLLRVQYACLWRFRAHKATEVIAQHLEPPRKKSQPSSGATTEERRQRMVAVCHTLKHDEFKFSHDIQSCLCSDLEAAEKIRGDVEAAAQKKLQAEAQVSKSALEKAAKAAKFRQRAEVVATERVKDALYEKLRSQPGFSTLVEQALKEAKV